MGNRLVLVSCALLTCACGDARRDPGRAPARDAAPLGVEPVARGRLLACEGPGHDYCGNGVCGSHSTTGFPVNEKIYLLVETCSYTDSSTWDPTLFLSCPRDCCPDGAPEEVSSAGIIVGLLGALRGLAPAGGGLLEGAGSITAGSGALAGLALVAAVTLVMTWARGRSAPPIPPCLPPDGDCTLIRIIRTYFLLDGEEFLPDPFRGDPAAERWMECEYLCRIGSLVQNVVLDFPDTCPARASLP